MKKAEKKLIFFEDTTGQRSGNYVQDLHEWLRGRETREVQYLEMKQMVEILQRFRSRVRVMVDHYRRWKADYELETDEVERVYRAYEGIFIRRQLSDAWKLYITVNKDYHDMQRRYLASLCREPHTQSEAA